MNRSANGGRGRACLHRRRRSHSPTTIKVIAGGTMRKNSDVTSGELVGSAGGTAVSEPISVSVSEKVSDARSAVERPE
jgi:hypothetical protein